MIDAAFASGTRWHASLGAAALVAGFLTLYSVTTLWTQVFWRLPDTGRIRSRRIPPAMIAAVALTAACTLGIGLGAESLVRLARESARQVMPVAQLGRLR